MQLVVTFLATNVDDGKALISFLLAFFGSEEKWKKLFELLIIYDRSLSIILVPHVSETRRDRE